MSILFEPGTIKNLVIRNRFVRSATFEGMANFEGRPLPELGRLYYRLAESDVGLIITSAAFVDRYKTLPDVSGLAYPTAMDDDSYIENWRPIVEGVHKRGAGIAMQIVHPGRLDLPALRGAPAMAPSAVPDKSGQIAPRAMTQEEIADMVQKFAQACRRVQEAGFDAVQLHGGHGYLISNFISPYLNVREDEYGGTTENRSRFILEIVAAARKLVGARLPHHDQDELRGLRPRRPRSRRVRARRFAHPSRRYRLHRGHGRNPSRERQVPQRQGHQPAGEGSLFQGARGRPEEIRRYPDYPRGRLALSIGDGKRARGGHRRFRIPMPPSHPRAGTGQPLEES